jgi:hypothetical protein
VWGGGYSGNLALEWTRERGKVITIPPPPVINIKHKLSSGFRGLAQFLFINLIPIRKGTKHQKVSIRMQSIFRNRWAFNPQHVL